MSLDDIYVGHGVCFMTVWRTSTLYVKAVYFNIETFVGLSCSLKVLDNNMALLESVTH